MKPLSGTPTPGGGGRYAADAVEVSITPVTTLVAVGDRQNDLDGLASQATDLTELAALVPDIRVQRGFGPARVIIRACSVLEAVQAYRIVRVGSVNYIDLEEGWSAGLWLGSWSTAPQLT